tara:strand:- start:73077 stop:75401 length:2325 start_codon:yes stop_codon:yes gene_type:complete
MKKDYFQAPGRGLNSQSAFNLRRDYLNTLVSEIGPHIDSRAIALSQVQNNIESYIGTIEIPMGLVGPLLFQSGSGEAEWVHSAIGTTEGALVASMNRGAKAISQCGGFKAHVVHQKMLRAPSFVLNSLDQSITFKNWIDQNFSKIKELTKKHSNHAELSEIKNVIVGKVVHLKFIYQTSDAAGQNMTTSCTWHACLWIQDNFLAETNIEIESFVIDGNGSSDKKVSYYAMQNGRGTSVISECFLSDEVIEKTLRTTAEDMAKSFNNSMAISRIDGMIGYNINVANAIAGIFASTGQDLASIHESSTAIFQLEKTDGGLYASLSLPTLVVGTVGGGTHFNTPAKILELMGCKGKGKVQRFAKLIAGFALSLELSTHAAIASGQFARAHQKLGRNKPVKWLLHSDLNEAFFRANLRNLPAELESICPQEEDKLDNGILTDLAAKASKKLIGFMPVDLNLVNGQRLKVLTKSKALGSEVVDGLHFMASNLNSQLADSLLKHKEKLEYNSTHLLESEIYTALEALKYPFIPQYYGDLHDDEREIHLFFMERLAADEMTLINAENNPALWNNSSIVAVIKAIHLVHSHFMNIENRAAIPSLSEHNPVYAEGLYREFIAINRVDYDYLELDPYFDYLVEVLDGWKRNGLQPIATKTLIHNDFNPRNVALRSDERPCIYDWELAILNIPQRDIFEFLAFVLEPDFRFEQLETLLRMHWTLLQELNDHYSWSDYLHDFKLAGDEFLITRACFYLAGSTLVNYPFIERVFRQSFKMLQNIKNL